MRHTIGIRYHSEAFGKSQARFAFKFGVITGDRALIGNKTLFIGAQCDQIGRFIRLWASFKSLWQQLNCPNLPHS